MEQFILVIRGPSGAGKTSVAKLIQEDVGKKVAHLRADYFYWKVCPQDNNKDEDNNPLVYKNLFSLVQNYVNAGYSVIIEGLLSKIDEFNLHQDLIHFSEDKNIDYKRVYLSVEIESSMKRNRKEKNFVSKENMEKWIGEGKRSISGDDDVLDTSQHAAVEIAKLIERKLD